MKKFIVAFLLALGLIGGTVAVTHLMHDSAKVAAHPGGD